MKPLQERDHVPTGKLLALLAAAIVVGASASAWSALSLDRRPSPEAPRPESIFSGLISEERPASRERRRDEDALAEWGWVDRERRIVRIPIDRAMDVVAQGSRLRRAPSAARPTVGIDEHVGADVPRLLELTTSDGVRTRLGAFLDEKPVLLVLGYERCPMLCGLVQQGLVGAVGGLEGRARVLSVSIDPEERPSAARTRRAQALARSGARPEDWVFAVADAPTIATLAETVGFSFRKDERSGEFDHPAAIIVLSPGGRVCRYLYGIEPAPRDVRLAVIEASEGKGGSSVDRLLLRCFRWDGSARRYRVAVASVLRGGAVVLLAGLGALIAFARRRARSARSMRDTSLRGAKPEGSRGSWT